MKERKKEEEKAATTSAATAYKCTRNHRMQTFIEPPRSTKLNITSESYELFQVPCENVLVLFWFGL